MIHWITKNLGTASFDEASHLSGICIIDVRDLVDKGGNTVDAIRTKIDSTIDYLKQDEKVVVCCDYGMSRSNAIAAGAIALKEGIEFPNAVRMVINSTGEEEINLNVLSAVRKAISNEKLPDNEKQKKRLLVTGSTGYLGTSLMPHLLKEFFVQAPTRRQIDILQNTLELDFYIKEQGITDVLHMASPRVVNTNVAFGKSLHMLKNVLDVCRENQTKLFFLSNIEIFSGYRATNLIASENLASNPRSIAGLQKQHCEILISQYAKLYNLDYAILRSALVYGGQGEKPRFLSAFLQKAQRGIDIFTHKYKNGFPCLDLIHVNDFDKAIVKALKNDVKGILHIGSGEMTSTKDIACKLITMTKSKSHVYQIDIDACYANIVMGISMAKTILGWEPEIDIDNGLQRLINKRDEREIG